jgi:hypothetical protein
MTHPSNRGKAVVCALATAEARRLTARLLQDEGAYPIVVSAGEFGPRDARRRCVAVVCDLSPWDEDALNRLDAFREDRPDLPVLVYIPKGLATLALQTELRIPNLMVRIQAHGSEEERGLRKDLRRLLASIPADQLMLVISRMLPNAAPSIVAFIRGVLERLGPTQKVTVTNTAAAIGLAGRTLERQIRAEGLRTPKEFMDWLTLMYIVFIAERSGRSVAHAAKAVRHNSNDLYRLRRRLEIELAPAGDLFVQVLFAFAERCDVPDGRVRTAIRNIASR